MMPMNRQRGDKLALVVVTLGLSVAAAGAVFIGIFGHRGWTETFAVSLSILPYMMTYNEQYKGKD